MFTQDVYMLMASSQTSSVGGSYPAQKYLLVIKTVASLLLIWNLSKKYVPIKK